MVVSAYHNKGTYKKNKDQEIPGSVSLEYLLDERVSRTDHILRKESANSRENEYRHYIKLKEVLVLSHTLLCVFSEVMIELSEEVGTDSAHNTDQGGNPKIS